MFLKSKVFFIGVVIAVIGAVGVFFTPTPLFAQTTDNTIVALQEQIAALLSQIAALKQQIAVLRGPTPPASLPRPEETRPMKILPLCPRLTENLYVGKKDSATQGQVSELQKFLAQDKALYPEGEITGFYGERTRQAVERWQAKQGIATGGAPESTGYGAVGPKTRAKMLSLCPPPEPIVDPSYPYTQKNLPPVIHGVSGPVSLQAGESGMWEVKASDPENQPLSYAVMWGDEAFMQKQDASSVASASPIQQTASFSHSYIQAGLYRPVFVVRDGEGSQVRTSITVHVGTTAITRGSVKIIVTDYDSAPVIYCVQAPCPQPQRSLLNYAKVSLYDASGRFVHSGETKDGTLMFDDLYPGAYIARASAPGYSEAKREFKILAGSASFLEIPLRRSDTVTPPPPVGGSLSLSPTSATLTVGESQSVKAIFTPPRPACLDSIPACMMVERAPYEVAVSLISDNPTIVSVDEAATNCPEPLYGVPSSCPVPRYSIHGISLGETVVTATFTENGVVYTARMKVSVTDSVPVDFITVLSPNGGERYRAGQSVQMPLRWSSTCVVGSFGISLYKSGNFVQTINNNVPAGTCSSGQQSLPYYTTWPIPTTLQGNDYKVRVNYQGSGSVVFDDSDEPFTVVSDFDGTPYDQCRLDKLDGTNITRDAIDVQSSCLSRICDIYGPANLANGLQSRCLFNGREIKSYLTTSGS